MAKYLVETYYTCTFKVNHYLDDINEAELKNLEKRDDGKFEVLDVKLDNRKTKSLDPKNNKVLENNKVDVVTETDKKNLINKETLSYLEENTVIGNAARGDVVNDDAMIEALKNGKVFAYGLDVYNGEPKIHPEYLKLKNIFLLPHLGSATKRTRWDMAYRATKNLEDFFSGKKPQDQVN